MPRGKGIKRSWEGRGGMVNRGGGGSHHLQNTFQNDITEQSTPTSQHIGSNRLIVSSHQSDFQHVNASQDDSSQQETPQNVSTEQQTLASYENTNPQSRRDTVQGIRPLKVNGVIFFPHDAIRDVSKSFKKSFTGSWHSWSKVPEHVRDKWFNDFGRNYSFRDEEKDLIRKTFERVGSDRLSDTLGKAKRNFAKTKNKPKWISQIHWDGLLRYWNSDDFKRISAINSKNRMTCNDGEGPSLHTGGSVAFVEYRRRHKEETGQDLRNDELFLKTHMTKDKGWICGKSQRVWDVFTENIKKNVNDTNSSRNENGSEVERDLERNMSIDGDEETEETNGDDVVKLLQTIPNEQLLNTWLNTVGGAKKGRIYGLGSDIGIIGDSRHVSSASPSGPTLSVSTQQIIEAPEFQQIINRLLEQRLSDMQASIQESVLAGIRANIQSEVQDAVRAVMSRLILPQPPNSFGSPSTLP